MSIDRGKHPLEETLLTLRVNVCERPASLCTRVDIREEKLVATLQEVQEYIYFHWKLLLDVSSLKRPLNERNRRVLANVLPCDSIYEEYTKVCVYVLANFRLSPRSTILFLRFFLEQKKKKRRERGKEGGREGGYRSLEARSIGKRRG